ncbi:MAG: phosphomannomutase/phosphoglucomutase [Candidatus Eisenbacteria bacterium]|uniref:Phosphomannomutase/phosphoglucomutase n=1 Tax=Eiseniibacteriota bacterium TaxID=2212470 RepID=A0A538SKZ1_UNCEI|nr:MAG: phosphomannomutase/phosphoglucomutase [Candidatus Eisenbacteria bacterium]
MIPAQIFREYDIRGLHDTELGDDIAEAIGRAYATSLIRGSKPGAPSARVALGRDVRPSSERLVAALEAGIRSAGLTVERLGVVPTPALYYAVATRQLAGGVQVTGSHNPPEFNGFKMTRGSLPLFGAEILELRGLIERGDFERGQNGASLNRPVLEEYRAMLVERLQTPRGLFVVMDCGNGCAGAVVPGVFEHMGHRVRALFPELDGRFPNHLPDPTVPELLKDLIAEVRRTGAELGIGFDGDADRIGAVDGGGRIVFGDQLLALLARDVLARRPGAEILFDVKCSQGLAEDIAAHGGRPSMWKTGHSLIKSRLIETGAPLAGEMSGHMFFSEGYFGFDDALFAAGRLLRYIASTGKSLAELVDSIPRYHSTPETRLACPDERKFQVVEELKRELGAHHRVIDIDGVRVEFGDGWGLVRASNTQPALVVRFEARTAARLDEIRSMFMERLRRLGVGEAAVGH